MHPIRENMSPMVCMSVSDVHCLCNICHALIVPLSFMFFLMLHHVLYACVLPVPIAALVHIFHLEAGGVDAQLFHS